MNTTENEPLIPAHVIQNRLKHLPLVADSLTIDRILARIPKDILQTIEQAKEYEWLPVKLSTDINGYIAAELGEEGVYNLSYQSFHKIIGSSIVSPLFRAALNIFRIQPQTLLKIVPFFWKSLYRNCGEVSIIERGPSQVQILFTDLPPFLAGNREYLMGIAGAIHGLSSIIRVKATVILENNSEETQKVSLILAWESNFSNLIKN